MTYRDERRLRDIEGAIDAIAAHLRRGDLTDGLGFDAVRIRLLEIGEAVKALPADVTDREPGIAWHEIARMRDHLAHRYFDTSHAIVAATVSENLPALTDAVRRLLADAPRGGAMAPKQRPERPPSPPPSAAPRVFSDKNLMGNAEGDRKILRRARQLADERNARDAR